MNSIGLVTAVALAAGTASQPASAASSAAAVEKNRHAFDFIAGTWNVHNRRLAKWLQGSTDWIEFEAISEGRLLLNGLANQDEYRTDYWPNVIGMSFRFFDRQANRWSIYWMDSRNGKLDPPVVGAFDGPVGTFLANDVYQGKSVVVRFIWSRTDTPMPRWEQAFSEDGGLTWETNWIMEFSRTKR